MGKVNAEQLPIGPIERTLQKSNQKWVKARKPRKPVLRRYLEWDGLELVEVWGRSKSAKERASKSADRFLAKILARQSPRGPLPF